MTADPIKNHFEDLAGRYDGSRSERSYGRFIHAQESALLQKALKGHPPPGVLNLACGTGRFMELADTGVDISPAMLGQARQQWPGKQFFEADAASLPFPDASFDAVFCLHLCMHLGRAKIDAVVQEAWRVLRPGGRLILDMPSQLRRQLLGQQVQGWHGATGYLPHEIELLFAQGWSRPRLTGLLFLPIHRLPGPLRPLLHGVDYVLNRSPARIFASHLAVEVSKQPAADR